MLATLLGVAAVGLSFNRKGVESDDMKALVKPATRRKSAKATPAGRRTVKDIAATYVPQPVKYEFGPADREMFAFAEALESEK